MSDEQEFEDGEETMYEVHVEFEPYEERLEELGISLEAFEEALARAIDEHFDQIDAATSEEAVPEVEDMQIQIGGQTYRITELADISISSDYDEDEGEYDDDEDDDEDDEEDYDDSEE